MSTMEIDKVLVFDIWGDYGHFRKIETTTSPLTYSIPPKTSLNGLLAAILGFERDSYYEIFSNDNVKYAIKILEPIKKINININLINTSNGFFLWDNKSHPHSPTPFEFIKDPNYRIYVWLKDLEIYRKLRLHLEEHKSVFTPYMGISECILNFRFQGEVDVYKVDSNEYVHTVIRNKDFKVDKEDLKRGMRWTIENIPLTMGPDRRVLKYERVLFEQNGKSLGASGGEIYRAGENNIVLL